MLSASFLDFIQYQKLFQKGEHLLLAISGGLDSVVLAYLLKQNNFRFTMAHMNFQLRGNESEEDESFVRSLAQQLEVDVIVRRASIDKSGGSTQIQARELRYSWFEELLKNHSYDKLLTAHHANDLLETALFNLSRGTGIKGLRSILPLHENTARPLLFASKADLKRFASENSIRWREDSSNLSDHYSRNKIRHYVVPQLLSLNPKLIENFQQTASRLRATEEAWTEKLRAIENKYVEHTVKRTEIDKALLDEPHALVYLSELLASQGFGLAQLQSFEYNRVGAQLLSEEFVLSVDRDLLLVSPLHNEDLSSFFPKKIDLKGAALSTPVGELKWKLIDQEELIYEKNPKVAYVDYSRLKASLYLDSWRHGDKIQPIGMTGKKKVSDILIDQKVSSPDKKRIMLLKCSGQIVWVIGHKFSDLFKVSKDTQKILRIEYNENA